MTQVTELRRAKQNDVAAVGATGENHPSKLLGDQEAGDLAAYNFVSGVMLDVQGDREAHGKFGEDADVQEQQWRTLVENMLPTLPYCIRPCSRAMWCSTNHPSRLA